MSLRNVALFLILLVVLSVGLCAAEGGPHIYLRYAAFDPLVSQPEISPDLQARPAPGVSSYYLVQFTGPVEEVWKAEVIALGADVLDYMPNFAFIVRMTPRIAKRVQTLEYVRWVGPFHAAYAISPDLIDSTSTARVRAVMFPGEDRANLEAVVERLGLIEQAGAAPGGEFLEALVPSHAIRQMARSHGVAWIEPLLDYKLYNDVSRGIMTVSNVWNDLSLYGAGEIVAMCDTGLDTGNLSTISPDFAGRIVKTYDIGRKNKWDDPNGHGTHVAGSVLGSGVLSGSNPATHDYSTSFAGMAPEAQIVVQSVLSPTGGLSIPSDLNNLFTPPYGDGARIHTNSWGAAYNGVYTTHSRTLDMFNWNNRDMTILFAAGNEGVDANANGIVDLDSMSSPATAKNCISVGGTENYRLTGGAQSTYGAYWPSDYPAEPIKSDRVSDNPNGMIAFSSRGPCDDGRIKPDICAPGTNVISARSKASGAGTLWGVYNTHYLYCGGTSMSTPLAAGASALVREFYRTTKSHVPSAALIKATLINGARELSPGQYGTGAYLEVPTRPNNVEGWGALDLANSLMPTGQREIRFENIAPGLTTGGSQVYTYNVVGNSTPFRATLVWTDYPASTSAATALVNDLDLTVTLPNATIMRGNGTIDRLNNVEGVDVNSPMIGEYTVTVTAYNVPYGPQPFALVVSGDMNEPSTPVAEIESPSADTALFGSVTIKGSASAEDFQQYRLEYGMGEMPSSWMPIGDVQTSPVTSDVLGIWNTAELPDGVYAIRLTTTSATAEAEDQVAVNVLKTSVSQTKDNTDGGSFVLTGKVVSASPVEFGDFMYIQEPDRSSGIRINLGETTTEAVIGDLVTVSGTLTTVEGERAITNPSISVTGSASRPIPLMMLNRSIGGGAQNQHTPGIPNAPDLGNIGLLVSTPGLVTFVGPDYFYIDDGSGVNDGSEHIGVRVRASGLDLPGEGQHAMVTGISSIQASGRLILVRSNDDLTYY